MLFFLLVVDMGLWEPGAVFCTLDSARQAVRYGTPWPDSGVPQEWISGDSEGPIPLGGFIYL